MFGNERKVIAIYISRQITKILSTWADIFGKISFNRISEGKPQCCSEGSEAHDLAHVGNFLNNKLFTLNGRTFNDPINQWSPETVDWRLEGSGGGGGKAGGTGGRAALPASSLYFVPEPLDEPGKAGEGEGKGTGGRREPWSGQGHVGGDRT